MRLDQLTAALADHYRIERELGAGGMATVYLAQDAKHDRRVAIKVLRPELAAVVGADRFLTEIKTTANLQHPHILSLFDSGEADGVVYYVMPFVEGESLRDRLSREKQLPIADAVRIATEVGSALDYAHRHGVIHRDIKPENILLHDGQALVADFGIALALSTAGGTRMTETGMSLGTPLYMSPEQAMGERDITARSDIYALGAVTYEMLVGEPPFTGPTAQAIIAKVMTADPVPPSAQRKTIRPHVEATVLTALQKLPADRFATAAEFAAALANPGFRVETAPTPRPRIALPSSRRAALGIALLVIGAIAGRLLLAPGNPPPPGWGQKTFHDEAIFNARFAPDGRTIVYSAASGTGPPQLFILRPDYPERTPLGFPAAHLLSISSTGELAVLLNPQYLSHRLFLGTLARMPLGGGAPRALLDSVREADWSPDGAELAVIRTVNGRDRLELPIGRPLYESSGYLSDPRVAPDGEHIAFAEHPFRWDDRGTVKIVDGTGKVAATSPEFISIEGIAWRRSTQGVVFAAVGAHVNATIYVLSTAGRAREVLSGAGDLSLQDISGGGRLLVTQDDYPLRLFLRGPGAGQEVDVSWLNFSQDPALARDGSLLAFGSGQDNTELNYRLMLRHTTAGQAARLGEGNPAGFSPDDQWVLSLVPSTPPRLVLYPTGAGTERVLDLGAFETLASADWFPDGRRILFCGGRAGEASRCYIDSLAGGVPQPVTPAGTVSGRVSPDGREVVTYDQATGWRLYPVTGGRGQDVPGLSADDNVARWSPDGRALYVWRKTSNTVERLDVRTGRRVPLLTLGRDRGGAFFTLYYVAIADDPQVYAYAASPYASKLFTVEGVRP